MRSVLITAVFALAFMVVPFVAYGQDKDTEKAKTPTVNGLDWLAGCWELNVPERKMTITEQWMKPLGGTLIGMGRTVVDGRTASFEYLRIVTAESGFDYIAKPSQNATETTFKMKTASDSELIFENPEHDFPQRIIYRKGEADSLFARIEGTRNGQTRGMDIPMKRAKCE